MAERRLGAENSKTRTELLDAAERLMRENGYAAVTSRRLAAEAGLKPQLVHYYFRTMDDLFVALFRRVADYLYARQAELLESDCPLEAMWALSSNPKAVVMSYEFIALANHRKELRAEIAEFGDRYRRTHVEIIRKVIGERGEAAGLSPAIIAVLNEILGNGLVLEQALGMTEGHGETYAAIAKLIAMLQGKPGGPAAKRPARSAAQAIE